MKDFFQDVREKKSARLSEIWQKYLNHLAFAIRNLNLVIDAPIILSGYLASYIQDKDINYLSECINLKSPFLLDKKEILVGIHGQYTPAIGAALFYIEQCLEEI